MGVMCGQIGDGATCVTARYRVLAQPYSVMHQKNMIIEVLNLTLFGHASNYQAVSLMRPGN